MDATSRLKDMAEDEEKGGCLKMIIGAILFIALIAIVYFVMYPIIVGLIPIVWVIVIAVLIFAGISTLFNQ